MCRLDGGGKHELRGPSQRQPVVAQSASVKPALPVVNSSETCGRLTPARWKITSASCNARSNSSGALSRSYGESDHLIAPAQCRAEILAHESIRSRDQYVHHCRCPPSGFHQHPLHRLLDDVQFQQQVAHLLDILQLDVMRVVILLTVTS